MGRVPNGDPRGAISDEDARAAVEELRSAVDLVRWGASQFGAADVALGHGTDSWIDEALALVLHALHLEPGTGDDLLKARLTRNERQAAVDLIVRRVRSREPAAYITGFAWFGGLKLLSDHRALVPRSPLAEHIERQLAPWLDPAEVTQIADLGTGGGCLAMALALAFADARVDAVDSSAEALALARENLLLHGLEDQVSLYLGDLYGPLQGRRYDLIVSNPPYVPEAEVDAAPAEFHHEPRSGLAAGHDGLDVVRRILADAPAHLTDHGLLVVEVGATWPAVEQAFPELPFTWLECERGGEGVFVLERDAFNGIQGPAR